MKKLFIAASMVLLMTGSAFANGRGRVEYRGERHEVRGGERREYRETPRFDNRFDHDRRDYRYERNYYYNDGCHRGW